MCEFIETELEQTETLRANDGLMDRELAAYVHKEDKDGTIWRRCLEENNLEVITQDAYAYLTSRDIEIDPDDSRFKRFCRDMLRAMDKVGRINSERNLGVYREDEEPFPLQPLWSPPREMGHGVLTEKPGPMAATGRADTHASETRTPPAPCEPAKSKKSSPIRDHLNERFSDVLDDEEEQPNDMRLTAQTLLSEAFKIVKAHKVAGKGWAEDSARRAKNAVDLVVAVMGDHPLEHYTKADILKARKVMERIPANHGKSERDRAAQLPIEDVIRRADKEEKARIAAVHRELKSGAIDPDNRDTELEAAKVRRLKPGTINNHLAEVGQIFRFAKNEMGLAIDNPFFKTGFDKKVVKRAQSGKQRLLDDHELEALFTSPMYTGCRSLNRRSQRGRLIRKDALYWLPLLEAFCGLRLEEASQLRVEDVASFFGLPWLHIHGGDGNNTKTEASNRCVPVHRFLIKLGFLVYVQDQKTAGKHRLFPELKVDKRGRIGGNLGRRYKTYRTGIGLGGRGKDGHALRHNFNTALHNEDVQTVQISELMSHARQGMTDGTYFHGSRPEVLWRAIQRLTYGFRVDIIDGNPQLVRDPNWLRSRLALMADDPGMIDGFAREVIDGTGHARLPSG